MAYDYSDLVEQTRHWAEHASTSGWISKETAQALSDFDTRSPESLFNGSIARPLIVAFMGGTGVGKSSLLNRLAGKAIARAGVERPTSHEVTLFHHNSVAIQHLPEQFPLTHIKIAQHDDETRKNIIWIDMPDFDSTEQSNKQLVLQWLPYIDVLIYVVSPERYRDEKAWRLLLAEGTKHAWLFVMNQWDRAQPEQYEDFGQQLHVAGFFEPVIFKTVCAEDLPADEFADLEATITSLATEHVIEQLGLRCSQAQKQEILHKLHRTQTLLASEQTCQCLSELWQVQWQHTVEQLQQGFIWPVKNAATYYAEHAADLISHTREASTSLWDTWAQTRFDDALDEFILNANQHGIPITPLKNQLLPVREKAEKIMLTQTELAARHALANPGNVLQRGFLKTLRLCEIILPLAAMSWVGYQIFIGFYTSNMAHVPYLGVDFAIHSSLLIAITWLAPFFMLKKAQPSLKKSVLRGLNKGLIIAFDRINNEVLARIEIVKQQHSEQLTQLDGLIEQCDGEMDKNKAVDSDSPLSRLLMGAVLE